MKKIEVVTHCLAIEYPHYAKALNYQLSSLILDKPKECEVRITVCYYSEDKNTLEVINHFENLCIKDDLHIDPLDLSIRDLGRRSIGRNLVARSTDVDIVWFTDVDHVFRDGILDRLATMKWPQPSDGHQFNPAIMIYPKKIKIHKDHKTGDHAMDLIGSPRLLDINPAEFIDKKYNRAIGGVQIVHGNFARQHGYLDRIQKWQTPANKPFGDFRDDIAYRNYCLDYGQIVGVNLPGCYRLRHSTTSYQAPHK